MQVHCDEGIANPIGPEPCVVGREAGGGTSLGEDSSLGKRRGICLARIRMERSHAPDPDPPAELSAEQRPLYDDMKAVIERNFTGFKAIREDGALIGPWTPWLRWPQYGGWDLVKALSLSPTLPRELRELAILVTGAKFHAAYQIYARVIGAERRGLSDDKRSRRSWPASARPT